MGTVQGRGRIRLLFTRPIHSPYSPYSPYPDFSFYPVTCEVVLGTAHKPSSIHPRTNTEHVQRSFQTRNTPSALLCSCVCRSRSIPEVRCDAPSDLCNNSR